MDKLLNNEGLVGCISYLILKDSPCDFTKLSILLTLLMDDEIRTSVMSNNSLFFEESIFKSNRPELLDRIYLEMLPVCLNSLVILIQNGIIETENNILKLTEKGISLADEVMTIGSNRLQTISNCVFEVICLTKPYTATDLFRTLKLSI